MRLYNFVFCILLLFEIVSVDGEGRQIPIFKCDSCVRITDSRVLPKAEPIQTEDVKIREILWGAENIIRYYNTSLQTQPAKPANKEKIARYLEDQYSWSPLYPNGTAKPIQVVITVLIWNDLEAKAEERLWNLYRHPSVCSCVKVTMSSMHRGRNSMLDFLIGRDSFKECDFTHALLLNQDVMFDDKDLDTLLLANKGAITALATNRYPPFQPAVIPLSTNKNLNWAELNEPVQVFASAFDAALLSHEFLLKSYELWASMPEWFAWDRNLYLNDPDFQRILNEDEEYHFCKIIKDRGLSLWVHPKVVLKRISTTVVDANDYLNTNDEQNWISRRLTPTLEDVLVEHRPTGFFKRVENKLPPDLGYKVVVATISYATVHRHTQQSLMSISAYLEVIGRVATERLSIVNARNLALRSVEDHFGDSYTHVLFIDGDMKFTRTHFERLLQINADIVSSLYVNKRSNTYELMFAASAGTTRSIYEELLKSGENKIPALPREVDAVPMGFTLIKRRALEGLRIGVDNDRRWFWRGDHSAEWISFCVRAKEKGFTVALDIGGMVGHLGMKKLTISDWDPKNKETIKIVRSGGK